MTCAIVFFHDTLIIKKHYVIPNISAYSITEKQCADIPCPIAGIWSSWSAWSNCSVSCNMGTRSRVRQCIGPYFGGVGCHGDVYDTELCGIDPCVSGNYPITQKVFSRYPSVDI